MNSFGVSESLILGGFYLVASGMTTEGVVCIGCGVMSGFVRYTTWLGTNHISERKE